MTVRLNHSSAIPGVDRLRAFAWSATPAVDRGDRRDQRHQLGDVVTLAAGQRHRQDLVVIQPLAPRVISPPRDCRQQRFYPLP